MEFLMETFPTEAAMIQRKTELEKSGVNVVHAGKTGPATDLVLRVWAADGTAKTQVVDLVNSFALFAKP
jgi:hypothetical protein